jgi:phosphoribosylamine--glycine ligase
MIRALRTSPGIELFCAPGNPGTAALANNLAIPSDDNAALVAAVSAHQIDLVIPGPETLLAEGITDALRQEGIACCGPTQAATQLEASKVFMRELTIPLQVPAPRSVLITNREQLASVVATWEGIPVVKADGLAGGKGVFLPDHKEQCLQVAASLLGGLLGAAGRRILLEERRSGEEASLFFACHGTSCIALPHARDHKRLHEGNRGPNTGGMGAVSPHPSLDASTVALVEQSMVRPTLRALVTRGTPFVGFLFVGIMLTAQGPRLLEFNVRLGDPEAEVILPRLADGAFLHLCAATANGKLSDFALSTLERSTCAVVLASAGYPHSPQVGDPITIDELALAQSGAWLLHNGTRRVGGALQTAGGRVLTIVGAADSLEQAISQSYRGAAAIHFPGMQLRQDIGQSLASSNRQD